MKKIFLIFTVLFTCALPMAGFGDWLSWADCANQVEYRHMFGTNRGTKEYLQILENILYSPSTETFRFSCSANNKTYFIQAGDIAANIVDEECHEYLKNKAENQGFAAENFLLDYVLCVHIMIKRNY